MISINTNTASSFAAYNLTNANVSLQRSLNRLSSGSRINSSFDDAGGLAVSMRLSAALRRTEATQANVSNGMSFLQTQDGVLKNAEKILTRLSELAQLSTDITKSTSDRALYQTEYSQLTNALTALTTEEFNDVRLFSTATTLAVITSADASQSVGVTQVNLGSLTTSLASISISGAAGASSANIDTINTAIQNLSTFRATNGSEQSRMSFAADLLAINKVNLEAANGRIVDVDVASESANLARLNILQQAGTAMLAQANQSQQSILRLLL
jgi:flagellin